jgi:hypothetical protein
VLKQHVRDSRLPRTEPATNNVTDYGVDKDIEHLAKLRGRTSTIIDRYHDAQQDILESFVDRGQLRKLAEPRAIRSASSFGELFERVYAPLPAGLLKPFGGDRKVPDEKPCELDRLYRAIRNGLTGLLRAVGHLPTWVSRPRMKESSGKSATYCSSADFAFGYCYARMYPRIKCLRKGFENGKCSTPRSSAAMASGRRSAFIRAWPKSR